MKKIISRILIAYALAVLLCTLYLNQCIAQNPKQNKTSLSEYSVRGKVTDTHNVPMPGVTVRYNHIIGTATDTTAILHSVSRKKPEPLRFPLSVIKR